MFNKKKDYTKSYKKAFKSIDDLIDIKEIYDDCILIFTVCKVGETKFFYKMYGRNDRTFPIK